MTNRDRSPTSLDEFVLIDRVKGRVHPGPEVLVGIGDDAAVLEVSRHRQVVACDAMVQGVHFECDWISAENLGRRLVTANSSDFAAMGAIPRWAVLSFSVPSSMGSDWCARVHEGVISGLEEIGASLIGGDTTSTEGPVSLSLTLGGDAQWEPLLRSGGHPGDTIWVTGTLGDSALGLRSLQTGKGEQEEHRWLVQRHCRPEARLDWGQHLAETGLGTAAADVSDGFLQDLAHVARASGCAAEVLLEAIPLSSGYRSAQAGTAPHAFHVPALTGGEDFELIFTTSSGVEFQESPGDVGATRVGRLVSGSPGHVRVLDGDGLEVAVPLAGWNHFRSRAENSSGDSR